MQGQELTDKQKIKIIHSIMDQQGLKISEPVRKTITRRILYGEIQHLKFTTPTLASIISKRYQAILKAAERKRELDAQKRKLEAQKSKAKPKPLIKAPQRRRLP